jgi:DNA-binding transcriptional regulator YiaG
MQPSGYAGSALSLVDQVAAAQLPPPSVRERIRRTARASLRDVAQSLGVTPTTVQRWESGASTPRRGHAIAYRLLLEELEQVTQ